MGHVKHRYSAIIIIICISCRRRMIRGRECPVTQSSQALWLFEQGSRSGSWWGIPAPYALSRASVVLAQTCRMTSSTYPQLLSASALVGGIAFAPYSDTGHANPALCGLTAGHAHEGMPLSGFIPFLDVLPRGVFRPRGTRDGGVVLIPTLTVRKKTAMHLFCGGKKGFDHDGSAMVRRCRKRIDANGGDNFK